MPRRRAQPGRLARVRGLGVSYQAMDATLTKAANHALRERSATYVSMGAGLSDGLWTRCLSLAAPRIA